MTSWSLHYHQQHFINLDSEVDFGKKFRMYSFLLSGYFSIVKIFSANQRYPPFRGSIIFCCLLDVHHSVPFWQNLVVLGKLFYALFSCYFCVSFLLHLTQWCNIFGKLSNFYNDRVSKFRKNVFEYLSFYFFPIL